jgi:hypothetical protein
MSYDLLVASTELQMGARLLCLSCSLPECWQRSGQRTSVVWQGYLFVRKCLKHAGAGLASKLCGIKNIIFRTNRTRTGKRSYG